MVEHRLTEQDGRRALRDHVTDKAAGARARHGPVIDADAILRVLADREIVRYPVTLCFEAGPLQPGEFAHAHPVAEHPRQGFRLVIHPRFEARRDLWPALIAYYIPPINYGEIAGPEDCEHFGAVLTGMDPGAYYATLCNAADSVAAADASMETQS